MLLTRSSLFTLILVACELSACAQLEKKTAEKVGDTYYLSAHGDDARDGQSEHSSWASWQHATSSLKPGDTLILLPGTYDLGNRGITLTGLGPSPSGHSTRIVSQEPGGAILTASPASESIWQPLGDGLYRLPETNGAAVACGFIRDMYYLHNYRSLQDLKDARNKTEGYHRGGEYFDGPPYGLAHDEAYLYLKLPSDITSTDAVQLVYATAPLVNISKSPELILDGFQIQGRSTAISIDKASRGVVIRNCEIRGATYGVMTDADNTLVEWCEFTCPGLERFNEELMARGTYIYYFMKGRGLEGGLVYSKQVPAPKYLEARYNYIHNVFDGDGLGQFDDSTIHHCVYHHCFDNAVEFEPNVKGKAGANLQFYLNRVNGYSRGYLSHQQNGVNRKQAEQGGWRMEGPHYVHHNVIVADGDSKNGWKPWTVIKSRPWNSDIDIYYAHNLIYARTQANLFWSMPAWEPGLAGMHWINNVILLPEGVAENPPPFTGVCNALLAPSPNPSLTGEYGLYVTNIATLKYRDNTPVTFPSPLPESPLTGQAEWIDAPWMRGLQNENIGPFLSGKDITSDWPRAAKRTYAPKDAPTQRLYPLR